MSQHRDLRQLVKDHDDPGRPGLIPSLPDFMGYLLTFLVCWGVYTLVVKSFAVFEEKKAEVSQSVAEQQKKAESLKRLDVEISGKVEDTRNELENRNPRLGKAFSSIADAVRDVFSPSRKPPSENRF